jgi:hypothetical protein
MCGLLEGGGSTLANGQHTRAATLTRALGLGMPASVLRG